MLYVRRYHQSLHTFPCPLYNDSLRQAFLLHFTDQEAEAQQSQKRDCRPVHLPVLWPFFFRARCLPALGYRASPFSASPQKVLPQERWKLIFFNISVLKQYYSLWATWTVASLRWSHKPWWIFTVSQWGWKGSWHGLRGLWKGVALGKSFM